MNIGLWLVVLTIITLIYIKFRQAREVMSYFRRDREVGPQAESPEKETIRATWHSEAGYGKFAVQVIISLAVLGVAIFIILSTGYDSETDKWAYGIVGTIMGYWLAPG